MPSTGGNASSPVNQWASVFTDADIGTPFQIAIPDGAVPYLYKRALGSSTWKKMSAGYADSAGSANTANSANSANVANTATKSSSTDGVDVVDTRNENPAPKDAGFDKKKFTVDFKTASKINSPTGCNGEFCGVLSLAPWSETSGGHGYQLAFGYASAGHAIDTGAAASNLVSQAFSVLVTVPCNAPQATINVKALSATSVRIANIIVVKIA